MKSNFFLTAIALLACISANADGTITSYEEALKSENFSKANEARKNGNVDEAIMYYKLELKDNPNNGYAWFYLGWNLSHKRQDSETLDAYNQALRFLPKNDSLWTGYAHVNIAITYDIMGEADKALQEFCLAIEADPSEIELWMNRALFYENHRQYDKAYADYEKMISLNDTVAAYYGKAGKCLHNQGLYEAAIEKRQRLNEAAIEKFNYAIKLDDTNPWLYLDRALCYESPGEYRSLAGDIIKAFDIALKTNDERAMRHVGTIIAVISPNSEANKIVSDTLNAKAKNDTVGTALLYRYLGDAYFTHMGSDEQSREQSRLDAIVAYIKALDLEEKKLEHTSSYLFDKSRVYSDIARCYDELGDQEMAAIYAVMATIIDPTAYGTFVDMADYCYYSGKYSEASKALEKAIKLEPNYHFNYYKRALMKSNAKDIDGAIEDCTRSITLDNADYSAYLLRGDMYMAKGDTEAAIKDYQTVLELDDKIISENREFAFLMLGQKDSAEIVMQQHLDNWWADISYYSAACLMSRMGDKNRAIEYLKVSLEKGYSRFGLLDVDYRLDAIRDMPEFKALVKEYKQKRIEKNVKFAEYIGGETRMVRQKSVTDCLGL